MADTALAGRVIASHYAEPLARRIVVETELMDAPSADSEKLGMLGTDQIFRVLDCSRGWAWGYAADGRVGYVTADAMTA